MLGFNILLALISLARMVIKHFPQVKNRYQLTLVFSA
jgi:hypothetical protein